MSKNHFNLGALNANTNEYVSPLIANKKHKYMCPECKNPVIPKQGKIKVWHFSHKPGSNCSHYNYPGESQIHKEAKHRIANLLKQKKDIYFITKCNTSWSCEIKKCISTDRFYDNIKVGIDDKRFNWVNNKEEKKIMQPDVYCFDINSPTMPKYIFEICNKNKTSETDRPIEIDWVEFDSNEVLINTNVPKSSYSFNCLRDRNFICSECQTRIDKIKKEKKERLDIEIQWYTWKKKERRERLGKSSTVIIYRAWKNYKFKCRPINKKYNIHLLNEYKSWYAELKRRMKLGFDKWNPWSIEKELEKELEKEAISLAIYRHNLQNSDQTQNTLYKFFKVSK
jgi:uncharacterized protein YlaI